jgi:hypothetical protein
MSEFVDPRRRRGRAAHPAVGTKVALLAGFTYTYLDRQLGLHANNMEIDTASTQLVDQFHRN